jgi:hypothetical protein
VAFPECFIEQPSAAQILSKAPLIGAVADVIRESFRLRRGYGRDK